ncbi:hypothetical protein [Bradyrhizobium sp. dw_78]|uniref:hypothetical protein n=1 Tax=Bradyrhizobium sp. dw_78 TaxID=2719793 RepID=UPI001BD29995|nr:hypothetical protein [Bradyrhizobium sp. dw_78]
MRTPTLKLLFGFWIVSNIAVILWFTADRQSGRIHELTGISWIVINRTIDVIDWLLPFAILFFFRRYFLKPMMAGLLVCCGLALSIASNEANFLREKMQFSLDHEISYLTDNVVEGVIRPMIAWIVQVYVWILGDDKTGGSTYVTHIAINYMFDSATLISAFALATVVVSPVGAWLYMFTVAFFGQASFVLGGGRMGGMFLAGGFLWQLFLLASGRLVAAIISGIVMSFMRTDLVFATAFAVLGISWIEKRWPSPKEWTTFASLIIISIVVPQMLISLNPVPPDFSSFLITHGDYLAKPWGNISGLTTAIGLASPLFMILAVTRPLGVSRTTAIALLPAIVHLSIVFLIADFTETRLLGPFLGGLGLLCAERLANVLQSPPNSEINPKSAV